MGWGCNGFNFLQFWSVCLQLHIIRDLTNLKDLRGEKTTDHSFYLKGLRHNIDM